MSEPLDKGRCFLVALTMVVVLLAIYMLVDIYAGRREPHEIRDLQRRVGELESKK